jgi:TonB family protein
MKLFFTLALLLTGVICNAQQISLYYLNNKGKYVDKLDSADYIRIVNAPDSASTLYNVFEYYKSGKKKLISRSTKIDPPSYEGQCITYYASGLKESVFQYSQNKRVGTGYEFYPNGKVYRAIKYPDNINYDSHFGSNYLILANNDSLGNTQVAEGQGYYKGFNTKFTNVDEEGPVKNGERDSVWKGNDKNLKITFTETYKNGSLVSGNTVDSAGVTFNYAGSRTTTPQFKGGDVAFGRYLGSHIIYPEHERETNIQGIVVILFTVEKNGRVSDIKVQKSVSPGLDSEAARVIKNSPPWVPGTMFGKPVRVAYQVPINFAFR